MNQSCKHDCKHSLFASDTIKPSVLNLLAIPAGLEPATLCLEGSNYHTHHIDFVTFRVCSGDGTLRKRRVTQ